MDRFFGLKQNGTTVRIEVIAGITTFFTMAYIIFVNPSILSAPFSIMGMEEVADGVRDSVFISTCLISFLATLMMGLYAKLPFALAPGMGLNAYFAFTVILTLGYTLSQGFAAVFISGILFIIITLVGLREAIVRAIPDGVKNAMAPGIGLFIALIGFKNAGIVVADDATFVTIVNFSRWTIDSSSATLAILGLVLVGVLYKFKVKGAIFFSILGTTCIGIPMGVTNLSGFQFAAPNFAAFKEYGFLNMDFAGLLNIEEGFVAALLSLITVVIALAMVDMFDTVGTLIGTAKSAKMLSPDGTLPRMKQAMMCDSIATTAGACLGTSTVTTYVESGAGISEGGKTGLTAVTTSLLFVAALFLSPLIAVIPLAATAPALIIVGVLMMGSIKEIDFTDMTNAIPAFLTMVMMPFTYSIANGVAWGLIAHLLLKTFTGRFKETHVITWIIAALFVVRYLIMV